MRTNKMMRFASALLVLTLLTTCMISATFAKYTTEASASDTARVAKWGVVVGTEGSLFDTQYTTDDKNVNGITYSVVSSDTENLVAPGTKNEDGITFTITGTPEVAVKVAVAVEAEDDVFLKSGTYSNLTTGNDTADTFSLSEDYYPVVYTLKDGAGTVLATGKLSAIEAYLEQLSGEYEPNTKLETGLGKGQKSSDGTYNLTWAWDFDADGQGTNDAADTLLGSLAADSTIEAKSSNGTFEALTAADYSLKTGIKVEIRVTQID